MSEEDQLRFHVATLLDNSSFVQDLTDVNLREMVVSTWEQKLTRRQQEITLLYMLGLMIQEDNEAVDQVTGLQSPLHEESNRLSDEDVQDEIDEDVVEVKQETLNQETPPPEKKITKANPKKRAADSDDESYTESPPKKAIPRRKQGGTTQSSQPTTNPLPHLDWVIWVPDKINPKKGVWKSLNDLSDSVRAELKSHFESVYCIADRATKYRSWYNKVIRNTGGNDRLRCVNNVVYIQSKYLPNHSREMGNMNRACDSCVRTKRLCVKLIKIRGKDKLGILPLPTGIRKNTDWDDLSFWVSE